MYTAADWATILAALINQYSAAIFIAFCVFGIVAMISRPKSKNIVLKYGEGQLAATQGTQEQSIDTSTKLLVDNSVFTTYGIKVKPEIEKFIANRASNITPEEVWIRFGVVGIMSSNFFRAYIFMYGSQLHFLDDLNRAFMMPKETVKEKYFDPAANASPDFYISKDGFDNWLNHLLANEFVTAKDENITIAPIGTEFLAFLVNNRLNLNNQH